MSPIRRGRAAARWMDNVSPQRWTAVGLLVLLLAVFAQSYNGRQMLTENNRRACERGKLDRRANERAWVAARRARLAAVNDPNVPPAQQQAAVAAVRTYSQTISELHARSLLDCGREFPDASPLP